MKTTNESIENYVSESDYAIRTWLQSSGIKIIPSKPEEREYNPYQYCYWKTPQARRYYNAIAEREEREHRAREAAREADNQAELFDNFDW